MPVAPSGLRDTHTNETLPPHLHRHKPGLHSGGPGGPSVLHLWHRFVNISFCAGDCSLLSVQHELNILSVFMLSHRTFTVQWWGVGGALMGKPRPSRAAPQAEAGWAGGLASLWP